MTETLPSSAAHCAANNSEDAALLDRLRAGADDAFGELFSRHSSAVFRLALGLVNDRAEAEDLTAEAFFRVLQAIRRGAGPVDNVRGYLLIVARRVAWEWSLRRRDVPVSDEELTHRTPANPDTVGLSTERNLIRRAFTSLPERWRNVLWKMEVEGERPAAVATKFGLSANATAALARRARQGLRAAYLQAHLASDRSATGCRSVLEKLGAYTAGSTMGIEKRRIRAHLTSCSSCAAMHAELRDVCSGLRAHAAILAVPVLAAAGTQLVGAAASTGGFGFLAALKGFVASTKIQMGLAATSAAAVGVLGFVVAPFGGSPQDQAAIDLDGQPAAAQEQPVVVTSSTVTLPGGTLTGVITAPERARQSADPPSEPVTAVPAADGTSQDSGDGGRTDAPPTLYDENSPVVYREVTVHRQEQQYEEYTLVQETTHMTEVNSLDQTRTLTESTTYTEPPATSTTDPPTVVTSVEPTSQAPPSSGP